MLSLQTCWLKSRKRVVGSLPNFGLLIKNGKSCSSARYGKPTSVCRNYVYQLHARARRIYTEDNYVGFHSYRRVVISMTKGVIKWIRGWRILRLWVKVCIFTLDSFCLCFSMPAWLCVFCLIGFTIHSIWNTWNSLQCLTFFLVFLFLFCRFTDWIQYILWRQCIDEASSCMVWCMWSFIFLWLSHPCPSMYLWTCV